VVPTPTEPIARLSGEPSRCRNIAGDQRASGPLELDLGQILREAVPPKDLAGLGERHVGLSREPRLRQHAGPIEQRDPPRQVRAELQRLVHPVQSPRQVAGEELEIAEVVQGLELPHPHAHAAGEVDRSRQRAAGAGEVAAKQPQRAGVQQDRERVVVVGVLQHRLGSGELLQRLAVLPDAQRDERGLAVDADQQSRVARPRRASPSLAKRGRAAIRTPGPRRGSARC